MFSLSVLLVLSLEQQCQWLQLTGNVEILHRAQMGQDVYIHIYIYVYIYVYIYIYMYICLVRAYSVYIQDLKNINNVKGCRDGMPKSMQTR